MVEVKEKENFRIFHLDRYIMEMEFDNKENATHRANENVSFYSLCEEIKKYFQDEATDDRYLELQTKAIIGHNVEVRYFVNKINEYLDKNSLQNTPYPTWYTTLSNAIFHENWGVAGISEWLYPSNYMLENSSSAKIIGDRIYYMIDGKYRKMPQTISKNRRQQLRKAFLLDYPKERLDTGYHEIYFLNGTRVSIFAEEKTKKEQDVFVFRKYVVQDYSFEKLAALGSIPKYSTELFKKMVLLGYNVSFNGPVRTGKSTFLTTWQSYEDDTLEGVMVETDAEIPIHNIMPNAPIIQLVADNDELDNIMKPILRLDGDYIILAEARDSTAFKIALETTLRGTRRVKMTTHFTDALDFPYQVAKKVCEKTGGDVGQTTLEVAKNVQYVFQFEQLENKSEKRLEGIYEYIVDKETQEITIHQMCKYDYINDSWCWSSQIGEDKKLIGFKSNQEAFSQFEKELNRIAEENPMKENTVFKPAYNKLIWG